MLTILSAPITTAITKIHFTNSSSFQLPYISFTNVHYSPSSFPASLLFPGDSKRRDSGNEFAVSSCTFSTACVSNISTYTYFLSKEHQSTLPTVTNHMKLSLDWLYLYQDSSTTGKTWKISKGSHLVCRNCLFLRAPRNNVKTEYI